MMDAYTDPAVRRLVVMSSAQVGKTDCCVSNPIGYHMEHDPAQILVVFPTLELAEAYSKERLAPMLRDTPALRGKVREARSRDSGNTLLSKSYTGGHLAIAGANSPSSLASRNRRVVICDEVNKFEASAGTEGDPVDLAVKRTLTYWNAKVVLTSTPGVKKRCRITVAYAESDQRKFWVPCHACGECQVLTWQHVRFEEGETVESEDGQKRRTVRDAWIECQHCGARWNDVQRNRAVRQGHWRASAPFNGTAGFHIWQAYSPWATLTGIAEEWLNAQGHPDRLKVFVNATLGEPWEEKGDAPDWRRLFDRRESYQLGTVPAGALVLTAGVDVQADRVEVQVVGWGRRRRAWLVDYTIIEGDTSRDEVWRKLTAVLGNVYERDGGGELTIRKMCVDSGFAAQKVYEWARQHLYGPVSVVKGGPDSQTALVSTPSPAEVTVHGRRLQTGVKVYLLNVGEFKKELYGRLSLPLPNTEKGEDYADGFFHICALPDTEEYCKQLTAEQLVTRTVHGYQKRVWEKLGRNEAIDTWDYAAAGRVMLGIDRWSEARWQFEEQQLGVPLRGEVTPEKQQPTQSHQQQPTSSQAVVSSGWMRGFLG
jgi:phage terminase large subunit GpA-like protein